MSAWMLTAEHRRPSDCDPGCMTAEKESLRFGVSHQDAAGTDAVALLLVNSQRALWCVAGARDGLCISKWIHTAWRRVHAGAFRVRRLHPFSSPYRRGNYR